MRYASLACPDLQVVGLLRSSYWPLTALFHSTLCDCLKAMYLGYPCDRLLYGSATDAGLAGFARGGDVMDMSVLGAVLFAAVIVVGASLALLWVSESGLQS